MSITMTVTEQEPTIRTRTLILRPQEPDAEEIISDISREKITSIGEGNLSAKTVVIEEEELCLDDWAMVPYESEEEWSITELAFWTLSIPIRYPYYAACSVIDLFNSENLTFVVDLFTAKGVVGTVQSTVGTCVGTFWGIQCAELISRRLINKTIALGCAYMGKSHLVRQFITAGANVIVAPSVEATIIILGGVLGGEVAIVLGNVCYILAKKHKDVIAEWLHIGNSINE